MKQKKTTDESSPNFEQSLKRLEEIVQSLEKGSASIDDSLNLFEEGMKISQQCIDTLRKAELRLKKLTKDAPGGIELDEE
jgi:exodeoxyribonuclease VII small subunit